jgi:light-regulated signal transduction histidine kinase (bacteriophytochrome)
MNRRIIGLGETVLDIIFRNDQPLKAVPGGSTFNAMISIGRTKTPCVMATEVGDDHVADIVTAFMEANNVDTSYVFRHEGTQSHLSLAFLNENNDAQYQFYKNHAALTMNSRMPEAAKGDIVLFGSYFAISPKVREYDLTEQVAECLLAFDDALERKHIDLQCEMDDRIPVTADPELLTLVWNNLLSNAVKFTPEGGTVSVAVRAEGEWAVVSVRDTGCGITPEAAKHIFDKFYQGDTSHATEGNGLGLALVKRVIDLTGGEISVSSTPGEGSTFTVRIRRSLARNGRGAYAFPR